MTVKLYDANGVEMTPEQLLEDVAKQHWIGFDTFIAGLTELGKEKNIPEDVVKDTAQKVAVAFSLAVNALVSFSECLTFISTPYASTQMMLSTILEFMFSAMICEKQFNGEQFNGEQAQKEFMAVAYQHASQVLNELTTHANNGTFLQRVGNTTETASNAPSTLTRQ